MRVSPSEFEITLAAKTDFLLCLLRLDFFLLMCVCVFFFRLFFFNFKSEVGCTLNLIRKSSSPMKFTVLGILKAC